MKIYPVPHPVARHSLRHYENFLKSWEIAGNPVHFLTEDAGDADAFLLFEPENDPSGKWLRRHFFSRRQPDKTFVYSEEDRPKYFLPGIYTSAYRPEIFPERVHSFAYISYGPGEPLRNRCVEAMEDQVFPKRNLFSFVGRITHKCRARLFATEFPATDVHLESPAYDHWATTRNAAHDTKQRHYVEVAKASHFGLCPRGDGRGSIRLYEMMQLGIAPVIISDRWLLPEGPDWESFSVIVAEKDVRRLYAILDPLRSRSAEMGQRAREAWRRWFAPEQQFDQVGNILEKIIQRRRISERWVKGMRCMVHAQVAGELAKRKLGALRMRGVDLILTKAPRDKGR